jgi:hypothetical protein
MPGASSAEGLSLLRSHPDLAELSVDEPICAVPPRGQHAPRQTAEPGGWPPPQTHFESLFRAHAEAELM